MANIVELAESDFTDYIKIMSHHLRKNVFLKIKKLSAVIFPNEAIFF